MESQIIALVIIQIIFNCIRMLLLFMLSSLSTSFDGNGLFCLFAYLFVYNTHNITEKTENDIQREILTKWFIQCGPCNHRDRKLLSTLTKQICFPWFILFIFIFRAVRSLSLCLSILFGSVFFVCVVVCSLLVDARTTAVCIHWLSAVCKVKLFTNGCMLVSRFRITFFFASFILIVLS